MSAMENLLIAGLVEALPGPRGVFPAERRAKWLALAGQVLEMVYLDEESQGGVAVSLGEGQAGMPVSLGEGQAGMPVSLGEGQAGVLLADLPAPEVQVVEARPVLRLGRPLERIPGVKGTKDKKALTLPPPVKRRPGQKGRTRGVIYDAVRTVLLEKGQPMSVREISLVMEKRFRELSSGYNNLRQTLHAVCKKMEDSEDVEGDMRDGVMVFSVKH